VTSLSTKKSLISRCPWARRAIFPPWIPRTVSPQSDRHTCVPAASTQPQPPPVIPLQRPSETPDSQARVSGVRAAEAKRQGQWLRHLATDFVGGPCACESSGTSMSRWKGQVFGASFCLFECIARWRRLMSGGFRRGWGVAIAGRQGNTKDGGGAS
jgi:hypothetical protein